MKLRPKKLFYLVPLFKKVVHQDKIEAPMWVWRGLFILGLQRQVLLPTQCQTASGCGVGDRKPLWDDPPLTLNV